MIKPMPLKFGDTVGVIAPASPITVERLKQSIKALEELGLKVALGESCTLKHGFLSGTDSIRANDINKMFKDKNINGILALRGGYGCSRLLEYIDFDCIKRNPKVFAGYSDITALHIAINQKCKIVTYHAPMPASELYLGLDDYTAKYYNKCLFSKEPLGSIENPKSAKREVLYDGVAKGRLIGGNLSLICSTLGTSYEINTKNKVLFIEEVAEEPYRIDRMLLQLHQSGKFKDANGIILGAFTNCQEKINDSSLSLKEIFEELILPNKKPVIANVICGHCMPTLTLPLGANIYMNTLEDKITVLE